MRSTMTRIGHAYLVVPLLAGGIGCVGGTLSSTGSASSPVPAPDAFACAREQLKTVGFSQTSFDSQRLRVVAQRIDETQRRPDTQFRRIVDRLEVEVAPGSGGELSNITVSASTFAELATQRGPTEIQEKASETARSAAQTVLRSCSNPATTPAEPSPGS